MSYMQSSGQAPNNSTRRTDPALVVAVVLVVAIAFGATALIAVIGKANSGNLIVAMLAYPTVVTSMALYLLTRPGPPLDLIGSDWLAHVLRDWGIGLGSAIFGTLIIELFLKAVIEHP